MRAAVATAVFSAFALFQGPVPLARQDPPLVYSADRTDPGTASSRCCSRAFQTNSPMIRRPRPFGCSASLLSSAVRVSTRTFDEPGGDRAVDALYPAFLTDGPPAALKDPQYADLMTALNATFEDRTVHALARRDADRSRSAYDPLSASPPHQNGDKARAEADDAAREDDPPHRTDACGTAALRTITKTPGSDALDLFRPGEWMEVAAQFHA